jgi:transcriptional regulator with XRE-family HTH domain
MDQELRTLERLFARVGFRFYSVSVGRHEDYRIEVLAWGPEHSREWFQDRYDGHEASTRAWITAIQAEIGTRNELLEGTPEAIEFDRVWNERRETFKRERGWTFEEHLAVCHGFLISKIEHVLLGAAQGREIASQLQLADLLGCTTESIKKWEKGAKKPARPFVLRLIEIERSLKNRKLSLNDEIRLGIASEGSTPESRHERPAPFSASAVSVVVEGGQALLRFTVKVPGETLARTVAEVLIPRAALENAAGSSLLLVEMPLSREEVRGCPTVGIK